MIKNMKKNISTILMSMLVILPLFVGCNNSEELEGTSGKGDYSGNPVQILVKVKGIQNPDEINTRSLSAKQFFVQPVDNEEDTGLEFETSIEVIKPVQTRATKEILKNIKFRMLAYKDDDITISNYVAQDDYITDESGNATPVSGAGMFLPKGDYTFVFYSYGSDADLDPFDGNNMLSVPVNQGDDFMIHTVKQEVVADVNGECILDNIMFTRQCSSIKMVITATGFPNCNIEHGAATVNNLNDPVLNWTFNSSAFPTTGTTGSANLIWNTLNTDAVASDSVMVFPISTRSLSIKFTSLKIGDAVLDNSVINVIQGLEPGKYYNIKVNIARNYIPCGEEKWAKGNIYKEGSNFYIEPTQDGHHPGLLGGSFFGWNTLEIGDGVFNDKSYSSSTDPCAQILPEGTWMIPTRAQTDALKASGYEIQATTPDGQLGGVWFGTAPNRVFLPYGGWRPNDGITSNFVEGEGEFGGYSMYETTPGYNQCFFISEFTPDYFSETHRSYGLLIRCVKTK